MGRRRIYTDRNEASREWSKKKRRREKKALMVKLITEVRCQPFTKTEDLAEEMLGRYKITVLPSPTTPPPAPRTQAEITRAIKSDMEGGIDIT